MGAALRTKDAYFKIGPMRTFWCLEKHLERYFPMVSEISSLLAAVVLKWLTNHSVKILPVCYYMSNIKRREEIIFWHILLIFQYVCNFNFGNHRRQQNGFAFYFKVEVSRCTIFFSIFCLLWVCNFHAESSFISSFIHGEQFSFHLPPHFPFLKVLKNISPPHLTWKIIFRHLS